MNHLSKQDQLLLDKFLSNSLTEEELALFKSRQSDQAFKAALDEMKSVQPAIVESGRDKFRKMLSNFDRELDRSQKTSRRYQYIILAMLFAALAYFTWQHFWTPQPEQLYVAHYEKFPNLLSPALRSAESHSDFDSGMNAYESANYQVAQSIFGSLDSLPKEARIYVALTDLELQQYDSAIKQLDKISSTQENTYREAAQWYLCLTYLKSGDIAKCVQELNKIMAVPNHKYRQKAIALEQALSN